MPSVGESGTPFDALSRLKGMETCEIKTKLLHLRVLFRCTFPFEGNGNLDASPHARLCQTAFDALSRLKGMETLL